jgi:hypothetical protein
MALKHLARLLTLLFFPLGCMSGGNGQYIAPKEETRVLNDTTLAEAKAQPGTDIALIKVASQQVVAPGTRGQKAQYKVDLTESLLGKAAGPRDIWHWGAASLQDGHEYITCIDSASIINPLQGTVEVPKANREAFIQKYRDMVTRLGAP